VDAASVTALEQALDTLNDELPPLKEFVLPGGDRAAAACHLARTICRRAERRCWELAAEADVSRDLLRYLNRLSDLLFVAARWLARRDGGAETLWRKRGS
jgi:cob(I)alamin adenosyltransferase